MALDLRERQQQFDTALRAGDWGCAAAVAEDCRTHWQDDPAGWLLGSIAALAGGNAADALSIIEDGLARYPGDFQCLLQRAEALLALGQRDEALSAADAAAAVAPDSAGALDAVGAFLAHARSHARALEIYDAAVLRQPASPHLLARRATVNRWLGRFEAAEADLEQVLVLRPGDGAALKQLGEIRIARGDQASIPVLRAALAAASADPEQLISLHFALSRALDDAGDTEQSWRHLQTANNLQRARLRYSSVRDRQIFETIIEGFPSPEPVAPDTTGESPIFIVGLPRTGTTLTERILGSHPQVHPAGELAALSEAIAACISDGEPVASLDWNEYATRLHSVPGPLLAREYLRLAQPWRGQRPRFTDKQPVNFFYCPLILRALPDARIVHVTRHPMAATHAIFRTRFQRTYPFAYDLVELADFIIGYRRLMTHWNEVMPDRIFEVSYESLVTSQEETTRRLLEQCGLSFEKECLEFHKTAGAVTTASSVQVRRPLYRSSLEHWRNYAKGLEPARRRFEAAGIDTD